MIEPAQPQKDPEIDPAELLRRLDTELALKRVNWNSGKDRAKFFRGISILLMLALVFLAIVALWMAGQIRQNAPANPANSFESSSATVKENGD